MKNVLIITSFNVAPESQGVPPALSRPFYKIGDTVEVSDVDADWLVKHRLGAVVEDPAVQEQEEVLLDPQEHKED